MSARRFRYSNRDLLVCRKSAHSETMASSKPPMITAISKSSIVVMRLIGIADNPSASADGLSGRLNTRS